MTSTYETGDPSLLRRVNTRAVLSALRTGGPQTLTGLASASGLSRQTTDAVLTALGRDGLVEEVRPSSGGAGRPARRFRFRSEAGHVVGVEIGVRRVRALVADLAGAVVGLERAGLEPDQPAADRLAAVERVVRDAARDADAAAPGQVWAVGVGTSGVVDRSGRVTRSSHLPGWTGLDLAGLAGRWFGCPGFAANDANLAAVAEHWRGSARQVEDVVCVLTGYRAGHGLLLGGRVHAGRTGAAGELGRLPLDAWEDPSVVLERERVDAAEIVAGARSGSASALRVLDRIAYGLAKGASALVLALDPELVVVAGELLPAGDRLLDPVRRHLAAMCPDAPEVVGSGLGEECVALGAIRVALDHVESHRLGL